MYYRQGGVLAQYDVEDNTDVIFLCGEEPDLQRIPAHSWVLVEKSPVFRAMFRGPLTLYSSLPSFCQQPLQPLQPLATSTASLVCTNSGTVAVASGNSQQSRQCSRQATQVLEQFWSFSSDQILILQFFTNLFLCDP